MPKNRGPASHCCGRAGYDRNDDGSALKWGRQSHLSLPRRFATLRNHLGQAVLIASRGIALLFLPLAAIRRRFETSIFNACKASGSLLLLPLFFRVSRDL